jgi:hypothetical protein
MEYTSETWKPYSTNTLKFIISFVKEQTDGQIKNWIFNQFKDTLYLSCKLRKYSITSQDCVLLLSDDTASTRWRISWQTMMEHNSPLWTCVLPADFMIPSGSIFSPESERKHPIHWCKADVRTIGYLHPNMETGESDSITIYCFNFSFTWKVMYVLMLAETQINKRTYNKQYIWENKSTAKRSIPSRYTHTQSKYKYRKSTPIAPWKQIKSGESGTHPIIILFILHPDTKTKQKQDRKKKTQKNKNSKTKTHKTCKM